MNVHVRKAAPEGGPNHDRTAGVIKLAILAVGGQGGGVVTNWIVALAEANGYYAQATSVPGVAQRTGATIYYIEMVPQAERIPFLSLMPSVGDVDIVLAAELMEAGRAIQRGFVTPGRTTLIASSHRDYAVAEKAAPGSGILEDEPILAAAEEASKRFFAADLQSLAAANGSVISASLFGALAGAEVLPFPRAAFEETIRQSGKGVSASLKAFAAGYGVVEQPASAAVEPAPVAEPVPAVAGPARKVKRYAALLARADALPGEAAAMARRGLQKVVDYQDVRYGRAYIDTVEGLAALVPGDDAFAQAAAKYVANAMAYDDVIRVADLKTRSTRFDRVRDEVGVRDDQVLAITEYMHPRGEEICGLMPAPMGAFIERRPGLFRLLDRLVNRGRRVRTDRLRGFVPLYVISAMRPMRRSLLRHRVEKAHLEAWLDKVRAVAAKDARLASEVLRCRRLVKGYSDTHARGLSKFDKVLSALPLLEGRADGADWLRRLREAALADEAGTTLEGALKTVATLDAPAAPMAASAQ